LGTNATIDQNPNLVDVMIQSDTDSIATIAGRDSHLTASSTYLLERADPATATTTDIEGNPRGGM
jgi:hypothetical protein